MITVSTKLVALLGNPLAQSLSTLMQNAAFHSCGLDYEYFPIETTEQSLSTIVSAIRCMNFAGFGVTKPDKIAVISLLDELDEFAQKMGAVNTVVVDKRGRLKGYNTDGIGFLRSLNEHYTKPLSESVFVCLGAGGAARAICSSLAYQGASKIIISSLFDWESEQLVQDINTRFSPVATMIPWDQQAKLQREAEPADLILNATGVGMGAHVGESPVDKAIFHPGMTAFDAAYNPSVTRFLADAEECGCTTFNGLGMLLYQGTAQFELWTGQPAPVDLMRQTLEQSIGSKA